MAEKESLTATAAQTAEQMTKQTQGAMENYFGWLQNTMSTFPWSNTNLNRILLSNATQSITATFAFVQKISQAKNFAAGNSVYRGDQRPVACHALRTYSSAVRRDVR